MLTTIDNIIRFTKLLLATMIIMALVWQIGFAAHVQYLDQYAEPSPFLMTSGFIHYRDCYNTNVDSNFDGPNTRILKGGSAGLVSCYVKGIEIKSRPRWYDLKTADHSACDGCRNTCQMMEPGPNMRSHVCPRFTKEWSERQGRGLTWNYPYHAICGKNGIVHTNNSLNKITGTLCDFPFINTTIDHLMLAANNCSVGFKTLINDVAISVAQTLYIMQSAFSVQMSITKLGSSLLPSSLKIEILDISSGDIPERNVVNGTTEEMTITKPTNIPLHVEKLEVRSEPYKVVIIGDKEIVKHWFYLHLVTTTRVTILVSKSGNTERNVACLTDDELNRRTPQNVESMDGPLLSMKKLTSETFENVTNPVIIHESAEFQCIAIVKSMSSCFPYYQGQEFQLMSDTRVTVEECWLQASEIGPIIGIIVLLLIFAAILVGLLINTRRQLKRYIGRLDLRSESTDRIPKENEHTDETKMDTSISKGLTKGDAGFGVDCIENSSSPLVFADMQIVHDDAFVS